MKLTNLPQPIPYQGSKRKQVPVILRYTPRDTDVFWEPFVGSGAATIGAGLSRAASRFVVGDVLDPLVGIWQLILNDPKSLCDEYDAIWHAQLGDPRGYYDSLRDTYNHEHRPAQLLYLIARCVKNAVRFNADGKFNQSPDKRRLGMKPALLRERVTEVHRLLGGRASAECCDYSVALQSAKPNDLVYMDPPYLGVSGTRDTRYLNGLDYDRFLAALELANQRGVSYLVSFDGRCGERTYGPGLPNHLRLSKIDVHVGRSSQATLNGRDDETVESLYVSPALRERLRFQNISLDEVVSVKTEAPASRILPLFAA